MNNVTIMLQMQTEDRVFAQIKMMALACVGKEEEIERNRK